jgi:hypothetical protein
MRVIALFNAVDDGHGVTRCIDDVFEVTDERGEFLIGLGAVRRLDDEHTSPELNKDVMAALGEGVHVTTVDPPKRKPRTRKPKSE